MSLSKENLKLFRNIGHNLKPIVTVAGNGLSDNVIAELNRALNDHELIKVKVAIVDREIRKTVIHEMGKTLGASLVQEIGKVALIFRASDKPNLKTSNVRS